MAWQDDSGRWHNGPPPAGWRERWVPKFSYKKKAEANAAAVRLRATGYCVRVGRFPNGDYFPDYFPRPKSGKCPRKRPGAEIFPAEFPPFTGLSRKSRSRR